MFFCRKNSKLIAHNVLLSKNVIRVSSKFFTKPYFRINPVGKLKMPVGKILFPCWKIIFFQLENYFFPTGAFFAPFFKRFCTF